MQCLQACSAVYGHLRGLRGVGDIASLASTRASDAPDSAAVLADTETGCRTIGIRARRCTCTTGHRLFAPMEHKDNCIPLSDVAIAGSSDSDEPDMLLGGSPRSAVGLGAEFGIQHMPSRGQRGVPCFRWVGRIVRRRSRRAAAHHPCRSSACPSHEVEQLTAAESSEELQDVASSSSGEPGLLRRLLGAVLRPVAAVVKALCGRVQPQVRCSCHSKMPPCCRLQAHATLST
jgi:hypothetical protein